MNPFSTGRPGRIKFRFTPLMYGQRSIAELANSLPLSTVIDSGAPRSAMLLSNAADTLTAVSD